MVSLNRPGGTGPMSYHSHEYADGGQKFEGPKFEKRSGQKAFDNCHHIYLHFPGLTRVSMHVWRSGQLAQSELAVNDPSLGFIRIFFYATGFQKGNGNLKVVPGSHLFRDASLRAADDEHLLENWMKGKTHPLTGSLLSNALLLAAVVSSVPIVHVSDRCPALR